MVLLGPIRLNGSKIGSCYCWRFCETPSENRDLAMMASDTDARQGVDDRELSFGRAHHDFHAPIGTLLFY
jgi:hypothetical protein